VLAANESFIVDDVREWKQRQVDSEVRHRRQLLELTRLAMWKQLRALDGWWAAGAGYLTPLHSLHCATLTQHKLRFG